MSSGPKNLFLPKNAHVRSPTTNQQENGNIVNCKTVPDVGAPSMSIMKGGRVKTALPGPGKKII